MGFKKRRKNTETAEEALRYFKEKLNDSLTPYFNFEGKLDLSKTDPTRENGDFLARILNSTILLAGDEQDFYFGADTVTAQQVKIEKNGLMRFWGRICWLSIRNDHQSYKPGYDPFYGEFKLDKNEIQIVKMKFGDHEQTNLDRIWWFDMDLDWMYEFEKE